MTNKSGKLVLDLLSPSSCSKCNYTNTVDFLTYSYCNLLHTMKTTLSPRSLPPDLEKQTLQKKPKKTKILLIWHTDYLTTAQKFFSPRSCPLASTQPRFYASGLCPIFPNRFSLLQISLTNIRQPRIPKFMISSVITDLVCKLKCQQFTHDSFTLVV